MFGYDTPVVRLESFWLRRQIQTEGSGRRDNGKISDKVGVEVHWGRGFSNHFSMDLRLLAEITE